MVTVAVALPPVFDAVTV
jgi:hypothetical protein